MDKFVLITSEELRELISEVFTTAIAQVPAAAPPPSVTVKESELITREDAKELLKVKSIATIDNLVKRGTLRKYYLGSLVRLKRSDVIGFMNQKNGAII